MGSTKNSKRRQLKVEGFSKKTKKRKLERREALRGLINLNQDFGVQGLTLPTFTSGLGFGRYYPIFEIKGFKTPSQQRVPGFGGLPG